MKKKMITLSLGFMFLIAGFSVSYDFDYGTFEVESNEVKAATQQGTLGCRWDPRGECYWTFETNYACASYACDDDEQQQQQQ